MSEPNKHANVQEFHVADCYVWAEIYYLDSATDYREYLAGDANRRIGGKDDGLVMLDSQFDPSIARCLQWVKRIGVTLLVILFSAALSMHC